MVKRATATTAECEPSTLAAKRPRPRPRPRPRAAYKFRVRPSPRVKAPTLCGLPTELLEKIVGYINIWHHHRIRTTCRRLRDINSTFIMHEYRKKLHRCTTRREPNAYESAVLQVIQQACQAYYHSGFSSTFTGCILPMLRSSYKDPFSPHVSQITRFIFHFYKTVDESVGGCKTQLSRLLFNLTLILLLKKFNSFTVISVTPMPLHLRMVMELSGPWLGILATKSGCCEAEQSRSGLLVVLAEMLIADILRKAFKRFWKCFNEIYVFGNDMSSPSDLGEPAPRRSVPRTLFTLTVHGSTRICALFRSFLEVDPELLVWPDKWPKDEFTVLLEISCKEAMPWGCAQSHHMEFSPFPASRTSD